MSEIAIVEAFHDLPDIRRANGRRHTQALCLALFTLAVAVGNRGFLAIGDWLKEYCCLSQVEGATPRLRQQWAKKVNSVAELKAELKKRDRSSSANHRVAWAPFPPPLKPKFRR